MAHGINFPTENGADLLIEGSLTIFIKKTMKAFSDETL